MKTFRHLLLTALLLVPCTTPAVNIVMMIGEDEYHTWETLPDFAEKDLKALGHHVTVIHAEAENKNNFPGLTEALREADFTHFFAAPVVDQGNLHPSAKAPGPA